MSYDIFCYRPTVDIPDEDDANRVIEKDDDKYAKVIDQPETKLAILRTLTDYNSKLEAIDYHYGPIKNLPIELLKQEAERFHHTEVNYSGSDLHIQLTIYNNHVYINFPYWHSGSDASGYIEEVKKYITIIRNTAGYFVFDPQLGQVYDPVINMPDFTKSYEKTVALVKDYATKNNYTIPAKKPWWKFWQ